MRIIFFGTPPFAAEVLRYLIDRGIQVVAVVTRPPKPRGRSPQPLPSAVAEVAKENSFPILTPTRAGDPLFLDALRLLAADAYAVVAYGQILPAALLNLPSHGCINLHASLLPRYRGAAPIQRALMAGELKTGITIIAMNPKMDAGDILRSAEVPIGPDTTFGELEERLCIVGRQLLCEVLNALARGPLPRLPQDDRLATLAPKLSAEDLQIKWEESAQQVHNRVRALSPRPGAWCSASIDHHSLRLKILRTEIVADIQGERAAVLSRDRHGLVVGCGVGAVRLLQVQPEGRRPLTGSEFLSGLGTRSLQLF
jgi:methionyl-tRNA formyltransferase